MALCLYTRGVKQRSCHRCIDKHATCKVKGVTRIAARSSKEGGRSASAEETEKGKESPKKKKMAAKKVGKAMVNVDIDRGEGDDLDEAPRMGIGMGGMSGLVRSTEGEDAPRAGLGSGLSFKGLGFSPALTTAGILLPPKDTKDEQAPVEDGVQKKNKEKREKKKSKKEKPSS